MFRAANNPFDDAVVKATDENLTSENWALILDVCDRVTASPQGPSSVIAALIKRLAHRNANVQLYTLELANALSQNCGPPLHRELASRSFTDALLRLANDRNTHQMVKAKVMERMGEWTDMFGKDPDLGIMEQAFDKLRAGHPGLAPPSKPVKKGMSADDRRKEEDELQMALALSLKDKGSDAPASTTSPAASGGAASTDAQPASGQHQQPSGTTAATVSRVKALYDFTPSEPGELAFRTGDIIAVLESVYKDWWKGSLRGQTGIFPLNYVEKLQDPTAEEMERDAAMEGEVFSQIRNVEKLLSLLSVRQDGMGGGSRDSGTEEEITELYNQTLAIRPKLIELIGKYSQKKDDFTQLNEKFIKARRDYEALLESSMSAPQYAMPPRQRQPSQPYYVNAYGPPQGYPPQTQQQGHPPQGPPPSQDPRYSYSSPPPDAQSHQQPPQNAYAPYNPSATPGPAPFHFLPNGAPPPQSEQPSSPPPQISMAPPPDGRNYPPQQSQQQAPPQQNRQPPPQQSQGGASHLQAGRPNSIHTLNSGNPQELGAGTYESPVEPRHQSQQYPPAQGSSQHLPLRQAAAAPSSANPYDSPGASSSVYSPQVPMAAGEDPLSPVYQPQSSAYNTQQQQVPQQPSHPPPGPPGANIIPPAGTYPAIGGGGAVAGAGAYQAYNPHGPSAPSAPPAAAAAGDDASDFYR
ncbi:hypothetical protein AAFC00_004359 [Neodothiora populina]|uniref:Class E vacuolar protein-sorting machinery protein HSE1 n=1 Tax=Neodothiora populina TaxID=2781224 RepID=A0ABR3PJF8_9PEZI